MLEDSIELLDLFSGVATSKNRDSSRYTKFGGVLSLGEVYSVIIGGGGITVYK